MELLKQRILRDGQVKEGGVLKVDSFLNHQMDVTLLNEIGREFRRRFDGAAITKIVTIEASGIGIAAIAAQHFGSVPVIFAKKTRSRNLDGALYTAKVHSFTKDITYDVQLSKKFLGPQDTVLILDDFLARGQALLGLIDIVRQAGAQCAGCGIVIEKQQQGGGALVRAAGVRLESLAVIASLENGTVLAYSFIYSPTNYSYLFVGLLLIVLLGLSWAAMFARIMHAMTEQMVKSVDTLVREIRVIRKEDPDHIIEIDTGDEIEEIAHQVNKMVRSIQELSQRNIALAEVNNRMEMQNLQAQINPHFIYNTLDNIRYLIPTDPQRAQQLIGRFIGILRYSINNTKHNVPVKDDLKYLQDYLVIQSTRFGANFSYEIDIDDACMEFIIPKLLLQPLLENSIKYGFQKKPRIHIRVRGWLGEDALYFTVEDNGGGVDETMLEQLRDTLRSDEVNIEHNGLQNINRRIWLGYGGDSGLTIDSTEGEGFTVKLKLRLGGM